MFYFANYDKDERKKYDQMSMALASICHPVFKEKNYK